MNTDIRISVTLKNHPKLRRLTKRIGLVAMQCLVYLWIEAAQSKPDGELTGWDEEDIAYVSGWEGNSLRYVNALMESGLVEKADGHYRIHDWAEHQPWAVGAKERSERARRAGLASAGKRRAHSESTASQPQVSSESTGSSTPIPSSPILSPPTHSLPLSSSRELPPIANPLLHDGFETLWEAYPRKVNKERALKAFIRINPDDALLQTMLDALAEQKEMDQWQDEQFVPHLDTWLNDQRWEDEIEKPLSARERLGLCDD